MQNFIKFIIIFILSFSVANVFADNFDITNINYSSPEAIDIIFTGDGFTTTEQPFFVSKALEAEGYLMNSLPINTRNSDFNTYMMELNSNESGISIDGSTTVDNFLGSYKNRDGMMRYTGMSEEGKNILHENLRKRFKKKIYVIVILNDSHYGGSGQFLDDDLVSITQSNYDTEYGLFRGLIIHEFGHSFGNLADEYGGSCDDASRPSEWNPVEFNRKNVTFDNVNDRKWDFLSNPQYILGANYCDNEWYRSSQTGIMRAITSTAEHNELGQFLINERIDEEKDYNNNLTSFIQDTVSSDSFSSTQNIHIHADSVTFKNDIYCDELYVAKNATLYMSPGTTINCNSIINKGDIIYKKRIHHSSGSRRISKKRLKEIFGNKNEDNFKKTKEVKDDICNINYYRLIKYGDIGEDVMQIQRCLNSLGYDVGIEDGIYGPITYSKIINYQINMKLRFIDGIIGKETIGFLRS